MVFKPGETTNPTGYNGRMKGYMTFKERAEHFCLNMTRDDIIRIVNDQSDMGKRNPLEVSVLKFIYNAITADTNDNLNDLFDRLFGKPKQSVESTIDVHTTSESKPVSEIDGWIEGSTGQAIKKSDTKKTVHH